MSRDQHTDPRASSEQSNVPSWKPTAALHSVPVVHIAHCLDHGWQNAELRDDEPARCGECGLSLPMFSFVETRYLAQALDALRTTDSWLWNKVLYGRYGEPEGTRI